MMATSASLPHGLGRVPAPDARHLLYPFSSSNFLPSTRKFRNWLVPGPVRDQGSTSHCVAYAWEAYLRAHPVVNVHTLSSQIDLFEFYQAAQDMDIWPGSDYEGTSVQAGAIVLHDRGFINQYTWAWDVGSVVKHLLEVGPVVVGTAWHWEMFEPDRHGFIWPKGDVAGGHAWLLTGCDSLQICPDGSVGEIFLQNSWGPSWGDGGRARVSFRAMDALIKSGGEACAAQEVRVR